MPIGFRKPPKPTQGPKYRLTAVPEAQLKGLDRVTRDTINTVLASRTAFGPYPVRDYSARVFTRDHAGQRFSVHEATAGLSVRAFYKMADNLGLRPPVGNGTVWQNEGQTVYAEQLNDGQFRVTHVLPVNADHRALARVVKARYEP